MEWNIKSSHEDREHRLPVFFCCQNQRPSAAEQCDTNIVHLSTAGCERRVKAVRESPTVTVRHYITTDKFCLFLKLLLMLNCNYESSNPSITFEYLNNFCSPALLR